MSMIGFPVRFETIDAERAGQRIDNYLVSMFKGVPKSFIYRILRKGEVRVNKKRVSQTYKLQEGDTVRLPPVKIENSPVIAPSANLSQVAELRDRVVYENDGMLVVNKPAGMAVHGGSGVDFGLIEAMRSARPDLHFVELVHRLDRETSGALMIAKKRSYLRDLHEQLRVKSVRKKYYALVRGAWPDEVKSIDRPLLKNVMSSGERIVVVSAEGKESKTEFRVIERFDGCSLIEASPLTGRTHQIRVHCAYAGHPIALDDKYGDRDFDQKMRAIGLGRMFLHAGAVAFDDPGSKKRIETKAPLDEKLENALSALRELRLRSDS